jgi:hypothetical protein
MPASRPSYKKHTVILILYKPQIAHRSVSSSAFSASASRAHAFKSPPDAALFPGGCNVSHTLRHEPERIVTGHKFKIGQLVNYLGRDRAYGVYQVTQLLPPEGKVFQYRIKNINEPHERVAKESELRRV